MKRLLFSTVNIKNLAAGFMLTIAGLASTSIDALAQNSKGGYWDLASSWSGGVPDITSSPLIKSGDIITVRSTDNGVPVAAAVAGNVTLEAGAKLIILSGASLKVNTTITFQNSTGSNPTTLVDLNGSISVKTISNAGTTRYFKTTSTGKLIIENIGSSEVTFPVGTTSYTPAYLSNTGTVNNFSVSVTDGVKDHLNTTVVNNVVKKTWEIKRETSTGAVNTTVRLQWNPIDEGTGFNRSLCAISHFNTTMGRWTNRQDFSNAEGPSGGPYYRVMNNVTSFSPFAIGDAGSPLPVELTSFKAVKQENGIALAWETASEKNNKGYDVQVSTDGKNFETMAFVASKNGNANYSQRYEFLDKTNRCGLVYYRLKQTDFDGTVAYYAAKVIDLGRGASDVVMAYPNPFRNQFEVKLNGAAILEVTDLTGKVVYRGESATSGVNTIEINMKEQPAGLYLLKATSAGKTNITRLVKQ